MEIPVKVIKRKNLPALVGELCKKGARPMTVTLRTIKDLTKKQRIELNAAELIKIATHQVFLNFDYKAAVNRQLEREGKEANFKTKKSHYTHAEGDPRPIVRHRDDASKVYLQLKVESKLRELYLSPDGHVMDNAIIHGAIPATAKPKNQGVDKSIITMTPSLDSVVSIICDKVEYQVVE